MEAKIKHSNACTKLSVLDTLVEILINSDDFFNFPFTNRHYRKERCNAALSHTAGHLNLSCSSNQAGQQKYATALYFDLCQIKKDIVDIVRKSWKSRHVGLTYNIYKINYS